MKGYWTKDGKRWNGGSVIHGGRRVFNPTAAMMEDAGYEFHEVPEYEPTLADMKQTRTAEAASYDLGPAINYFTIDGEKIWWKKAERVGFANMLEAELADGETESLIWINNRPFTLPITRWKEILREIERYAGACKRNTCRHRAAIASLTTKDEVEGYDYTTGYPEPLNIKSIRE